MPEDRLGISHQLRFDEALLFQWINPEGWVTALGALAAFTNLGADLQAQTFLVAGVLAAACLASVARWDAAQPGRELINLYSPCGVSVPRARSCRRSTGCFGSA